MKYTINELANSKGVSQPVREALLHMEAELDATNRQVEILCDALAESRREVAAKDEDLKLVLEALEYADEMIDTVCVPNAITAIKQALAAPVQDSTCNNSLREQGKAYPRTCRKCGKGPCVALANAALDKMAENARELGLDYEPVLKDNSNYRYDPPVAEPVGEIGWGGSVNWHKSIPEFGTDLYTTPPAAPVPLTETQQIAEALRQRGLTLLKTSTGYTVLKLGPVQAQATPPAAPAAAPVQVLQRYSPDGEGGMELDSLGAYIKLQDVSTPPAAQRQWVGLTDEEVMNATRKEGHELLDFIYEYGTGSEGTEERVVAICKAIEAKLKEKNT
jgi:hypothetical protein